MLQRKKSLPEACTAVARELLGFVWAIAHEVQSKRKSCVAASAKISKKGR